MNSIPNTRWRTTAYTKLKGKALMSRAASAVSQGERKPSRWAPAARPRAPIPTPVPTAISRSRRRWSGRSSRPAVSMRTAIEIA